MKLKFVIIILFAFLSMVYGKSKDDPNIFEHFSNYYITNKDGKAIYKEPNINSEKVFIVPYGVKVDSTKIAIKELWYYIEWNGHKGWTSIDDLSESQPLPFYPKNTVELKKLLTSGSFTSSCDIFFKLDENGTGEGGYDHCAGGEPTQIKKLTWKGNNPFYVTIVKSIPIGSDSFNSATSYEESTETIIITYDYSNNCFSTNALRLHFEYEKSK